MSLTIAQTFLLEEYKALRKEIELYLTESRLLERNTVIAVGVIWGWLIASKKTNDLLWSMPLILTIASGVIMIAINAHFTNLGKYIKELESKFDAQGWEHRGEPRNIGLATMILSGALVVLAIFGLCMKDTLIK